MRAILVGVCLLCVSAPALAQGPRILALTPADPTPDWPSGLAIELAHIGGRVVRSPLATGTAAADPVLSARVAAQVVGAEAAVWLGPGGQSVQVALAGSEQSFIAPLADATDGRTIALVAASLLEEAFATATASAPPLAASATPRDELATPVGQVSDDERPDVHRALPARPEAGLAVAGFAGIGTGGLALISDVAFDPGTLLRGLVGVRIGPHLQLQASVEAGFLRERIGLNSGGLELQPFGRLCPEVAAVIPIGGIVGLQIGGHGCVGVAELRHHGGGFDPFGGAAWTEAAVVTVAGGGFVALELQPSRAVSVAFRADVDGFEPAITTEGDYVSRQSDVLASISTVVGFW